ncbi:MAG: HDOD domain-containing protein [Steroidobacteraceae bacterium]
MSLFFWRKQKAGAAAAPPDPFAVTPTAAVTPVPAAPEPPAHPSAMREVYALALQSRRAADATALPDPGQMTLLLAASREFAQIGIQPRYTPRRPSLLPQLLEALDDEDASLRALSRIVSQDPQLTGDLLRTANSAMYRVSSTPVESVERAAAMLGTRGIRSLLSASLVHPLATSGGSLGRFGDMLWDHSLYSASAAEAWAGRSQDADPFTAHLLALMHGLGCVAVYRVLADLYAAQPALPRDAAVIAGALTTNAAVTAARIAASWGLTERTRQALEAQSSAAPVNDHLPLSQALQFGLLTGAVTLLCKHGKLPANEALQQIVAGGFPAAQAERIWDRMQRAYVTP